MHCPKLHYIILPSITQHYTALLYTALPCHELYCPTSQYSCTLHSTLPSTAPSSWPAARQLPPLDYWTLLTPTCKVQYTELYWTALQCSAHYCAVHCAALHSTVVHCNLLTDTVHRRGKPYTAPIFTPFPLNMNVASNGDRMRCQEDLHLIVHVHPLVYKQMVWLNWDCLAVVQLQTDWLLVRVKA